MANNSYSESYKAAGVDITAGYEAVRLMKKHIGRTVIPGTLSGIGGFGGLFQPDLSGIREPVLVSGTDGVGTKLKIAFLMDKHDTVGIDCVAMCVNDVVCCGARPLFFLDYVAVGKNVPSRVADIVSGVAEGCVRAGCALIGGETAEMPGFYADGEYDIAGFAVGIVDKKNIINGKNIQAGDALIGIASSGIHSNGYSLVRRLFGDSSNSRDLDRYDDRLKDKVLNVLLTPTKIYVRTILGLISKVKVKGIAHITGGGFIENIPRIFPEGIGCEIVKDSYPLPAIFQIMQERSELSDREIYNTFNMGIGMVVCVAQADAERTVKELEAAGERAYVIGKTVEGSGVTLL